MDTLTKYQYRTLLKLANGSTKIFCSVSGMPNDRDEDAVNRSFNEILRLVELKLLKDITNQHDDIPAYQEFTKDGREIVIVNLTHRGQWMFERVSWEKWVN